MEDQMTFDEALANMTERYEHAATLLPEERSQYAKDSAVIESRYPNGATTRFAKAIRCLHTKGRPENTGGQAPSAQTLKDAADPRFLRLLALVEKVKRDLIGREN